MKIIRGKRKEYEHLCNDIDHKYIEELKDYIKIHTFFQRP